MLSRLAASKPDKALRSELLLILVNLLDERSLSWNREAFIAIDRDNSGSISKQRLQEYMETNLP